jgi:hypothetical protein
MPKKKVTPERPRDVNQLAKRIVDIATGQASDDQTGPLPDPAAVKRGEARAKKLAPSKRSAIAKKAARARWNKEEG